MKYKALLFDLDGTLIDSIPLWEQAMQEMFSMCGITLTHEDFCAIYAPSAQMGIWLQKYGIDPARQDELRAIRNARYIDLLRTRVTWCPDARELLEHLRGNVPLALLTNSHREWVEAIDERLSLLQYFTVVLTADEMGNIGKSHPHNFLVAADRMGVDPAMCANIGDMDIDVDPPHQAGMQSIIVRTPLTPHSAIANADIVVKNLRELKAIAEL